MKNEKSLFERLMTFSKDLDEELKQATTTLSEEVTGLTVLMTKLSKQFRKRLHTFERSQDFNRLLQMIRLRCFQNEVHNTLTYYDPLSQR